MLEYYLEPNLLTDAPDDCSSGKPLELRSFHLRENSIDKLWSFGFAKTPRQTGTAGLPIIERIMGIGAGLTRSDVMSVFEAEKQVCAAIIAEGGAINTELWVAHPSIQGVFTASAEPDAHTVRINLHAGKVLRDAIAGMRTRKVPPVQTGTIIESVTDVKTSSVNGNLTPNRDLRITGVKLKIAGEDPGNGLFFVNAVTGERTQVDPTDIVENNPSNILAVIPALAAGTYHVQVVTQFNGSGRPLNAPRITTFDKPLTVAAPESPAT
jgi:hypothetical protein